MDKSARLSSETADLDGTPVVRLYGEIDLYTAPAFGKALEDEIDRGVHALIVDLTNISYLDSSGLRVLLVINNELADKNAVLYVIADPGSPGVRRVLQVTRFDTIFKVFSSIDEVKTAIRTPRAA